MNGCRFSFKIKYFTVSSGSVYYLDTSLLPSIWRAGSRWNEEERLESFFLLDVINKRDIAVCL